MKFLLRLEEVAQFALAFMLFIHTGARWWMFFAWLLAPDLSMIGYLAGPRIGAWCYNFFHHKLLAVAVFVTGLLLHHDILQLAGLILFGHSAMDRIFGYGLKRESGFTDTHMGSLNKTTIHS